MSEGVPIHMQIRRRQQGKAHGRSRRNNIHYVYTPRIKDKEKKKISNKS